MKLQRRAFLGVGAAGPLAFAAATTTPNDRNVLFVGDGIPHTPADYSRLLARIVEERSIKADDYSREGVVAALEEKFAAALGKERAVFFPTGTLANHLALRTLAGDRRRAIVQQECHLYNDCGDCAQTLSALNLIPLAAGKATFTLDEVEKQMERAKSGRVDTPIGAMMIESPVRRRSGEVFDFAELKRVAAYAREKNIGTHFDGARVYLAAPYSGVSVREYAGQFDTVYISLYKYFNAASGAMLAGPRALLDQMYQPRRMFGGGLHQVWPFAAVALHYFDGFEDRYSRAVKASEELIRLLQADRRFQVERIPSGSNIFGLRLKTGDPKSFSGKLATAGITVRPPAEGAGRMLLSVNETIVRRAPEELARAFQQAV